MEIRTVGVVGCGLMGSGIAQVSAQAGYRTIVREVTEDLLSKGLSRIDKFLKKSVEKGKMQAPEKDAVMARISGTVSLDGLKECDIVIEAIIEDYGKKKELYSALDVICGPDTVFASNTSSLSVTEMMTATKRPQKFVGLHFFNPVPLMKLVEVVHTISTDTGVIETVTGFARSLGKTPIQAGDKSGFIVNRLLVPYILDAIRALEEGVGSIEDIDTGMKLGCGHPMGPLTLLDLVGLDTTYYIANIMFEEFREKRFASPPLLKRMVMAGYHGRKTGRGFYDYSTEPPKPNTFLTR